MATLTDVFFSAFTDELEKTATFAEATSKFSKGVSDTWKSGVAGKAAVAGGAYLAAKGIGAGRRALDRASSPGRKVKKIIGRGARGAAGGGLIGAGIGAVHGGLTSGSLGGAAAGAASGATKGAIAGGALGAGSKALDYA